MHVTLREAAAELGYTPRSLATIMLRHPDRWPAPVATRLAQRAHLYDLDALRTASAGGTAPLSRKAATVSDPDGLITCLECGKRMRALERHLRTRHEITSAEYRDRYGLPRTAALKADQTRRKVAERARETLDERMHALAPYQGRERLAELQRRGVPHLRESFARPVAEEHRAPARRKAVQAMRESRRARLDEQARAVGWADLVSAIEATRNLSCAKAAALIGIGASTVHRHRRDAESAGACSQRKKNQ